MRTTDISLRDIAVLLADTDCSFSLEITKNTVSMNLGESYTPVGVENSSWENDENPDISLEAERIQDKWADRVLLYPDHEAALRLL